MNIYAVILNEPDADAWDRLKEAWPSAHYILTDRIAFIGSASVTLTEMISETVGLNEDHEVLGLVVQLDDYFGYNNPSLWEWMHKMEEEK